MKRYILSSGDDNDELVEIVSSQGVSFCLETLAMPTNDDGGSMLVQDSAGDEKKVDGDMSMGSAMLHDEGEDEKAVTRSKLPDKYVRV